MSRRLSLRCFPVGDEKTPMRMIPAMMATMASAGQNPIVQLMPSTSGRGKPGKCMTAMPISLAGSPAIQGVVTCMAVFHNASRWRPCRGWA